MVKNHKLAKSIADASWYQFTDWLGHFAKIFGTGVVRVAPHFTTQDCSNCATRVKKSLSTRTHKCHHCGTVLDRDHNAAKNILAKNYSWLVNWLKIPQGMRKLTPRERRTAGLSTGIVGISLLLILSFVTLMLLYEIGGRRADTVSPPITFVLPYI